MLWYYWHIEYWLCSWKVCLCGVSGALTGIFSQILHGDEQIRERAITFLSTKIRVLLVEDMLPKDAEEELVTLCKQVK